MQTNADTVETRAWKSCLKVGRYGIFFCIWRSGYTIDIKSKQFA